jgi:hypothetical protein
MMRVMYACVRLLWRVLQSMFANINQEIDGCSDSVRDFAYQR